MGEWWPWPGGWRLLLLMLAASVVAMIFAAFAAGFVITLAEKLAAA